MHASEVKSFPNGVGTLQKRVEAFGKAAETSPASGEEPRGKPRRPERGCRAQEGCGAQRESGGELRQVGEERREGGVSDLAEGSSWIEPPAGPGQQGDRLTAAHTVP